MPKHVWICQENQRHVAKSANICKILEMRDSGVRVDLDRQKERRKHEHSLVKFRFDTAENELSETEPLKTRYELVMN